MEVEKLKGKNTETKKISPYYHTDNKKFSNKEKYKPLKIQERIFDEKNEKFEYKTVEVNEKQNWENEWELIQQLSENLEIGGN